MRVVVFSDSHGLHESLAVPPCDVLIVAGDFLNHGALGEVRSFYDWFKEQSASLKIVVAGNHDHCFQSSRTEAVRLLVQQQDNIRYLQDEEVQFRGVRFYGSPWTPEFNNWAFMLPRGTALAEKWAAIPEGLDFLITHGPPLGTLDRVYAKGPRFGWHRNGHVGCEDLLRRVEVVKPRYHLFGHIHEQGGRVYHVEAGGIAQNVSVLDETYELRRQPAVIEYPK